MSELVFLYPTWLWLLVPLVVITLWLCKRTRSKSLIATHLSKAVQQVSRHTTKQIALSLCLGASLAIIALAGPSFSQAERPSYTNTSARVLVMDMSRSMYANDIKPNRLTQARYKAMDLLQLWSEGQTGLVAYAAMLFNKPFNQR
ncbi:TPR domain protein in aerotolerance operon [Vibrio ponticus]|nr:TPR domain protein in aerotolerance operon [Vibrio ponticus]